MCTRTTHIFSYEKEFSDLLTYWELVYCILLLKILNFLINSYVTGHEIFHQIQPLLRFVMNHPPSKLTFLPVLSTKHFNATDKLRVRDAVAL